MTLQAELQILRDTRQLLSDPDRWVRGKFETVRMLQKLEPVPFLGIFKRIQPVDREVTAYCLAGAMNFCATGETLPRDRPEALEALRQRIATLLGADVLYPNPMLFAFHYASVIHSYNDRSMHYEVLGLIDDAIAWYEEEIEREAVLELAAMINECEPEPELVA